MKFDWVQNQSSGKHLVGLILLSFSTILLLVFLNSMQPFLLKDIYDEDVDQLGRTSGTLSLADEIASFLFLGIWGLVFDLFGGIIVIAAGSGLVSLSLFIFPNVGNVFPGVLLVRLIFAIGSAGLTTMLTVVLSNVIRKEKMGYGAGLISVASGCGALVALFVLIGSVPPQICVENTYYVVGCFAALNGTILIFLLKGLPLNKKEDSLSIKELVRDAFKVFVSNIQVQAACFAGFGARAGSIMVTAFVSLWVVRFYDEQGLCEGDTNSTEISTCGEDLVNIDKRSCAEAFTTTSSISGVSQVVVLIFALIFGIVGVRIKNIFKGISIAAFLGAIAYGITPVFEDPTSSALLGGAVLWGLADVAMIVFAQIAIALEIAKLPSIKGSLAGLFSMCGALGIVTITYFGGFLFDVWIPQAPFVLLSILSVLLGFLSCRASRQENMEKEKITDLTV